MLLVVVAHIVADSARVESLALLAFEPAFAFIVAARLDLFSRCAPLQLRRASRFFVTSRYGFLARL